MSDPACLARLRARWRDHTAGLDARRADAAFDGIVAAYSEPHRAYHTLAHLDFLFARLDEHAGDAAEPARLAFAAWYHDIIYDTARSDNEARSAERAETELAALGLEAGLVARIAALIRATAAHQAGGSDRDDALFLDADFAILGADPETYRRYAAEVRREYARLDDATWRAGRGAFLRKALTQTRFFLTDRFEATYGAAARANIAAELAALT